jgi:excisionase family DNA binding protein
LDADIGYFGKSDKTISTTLAARLLRCSTTSVHRKIEDGTLRAYRPWPGAHYHVSRLSVLQILNGISEQIAQAVPSLAGRRDS